MTSRENSSNVKHKPQSSMQTVQINCQICFENVKEPCVCSNMHVFCSFCLNIWLEKNNQCPTCHVRIDETNPPKHLIGQVQNFDSSLLSSAEFSEPSIRKARYLTIFQLYEDEIGRLNNLITSLQEEVVQLKEKEAKNFDSLNSPQQDMIQLLKNKLQFVQMNYSEACQENQGLKEKYKKLENENFILTQDITRLKASLNEKTSQLGSKLIADSLQSKIQTYEKEIKFLKKSLTKSEKYIASLQAKRDSENKHNGKFTDENFQSNSSSAFSFVKPSNLTSSLNSAIKIKTDFGTLNKSDLKSVKFSERIDKFPANITTSASSNSPKYSTNKNVSNLKNVKLKKNLFTNSNTTSNDFDANNQFSQSMLIMNNNQSSNFLSSNSSSSFSNPPNNQSFAYSTLRKLRKDEVGLEKPDEPKKDKKSNSENLNTSNSEFIDCMEILNRAEKNVQNRQKSPTRPVQNSNLSKNFLEKMETNGLVQMKSDSSIHSSSSSGNSLSANGASSISSFANSPSDSSANLNSSGKKVSPENSKSGTFNMNSFSFNSYNTNSKNDIYLKEHAQNLSYNSNNNGINISMINRSRTVEPISRNLK